MAAMLWPHIQQQLRLDSGGSFFGNASHDLKTNWAAFCKNMTELVQSESEAKEVINGSIETYISLNKWFNQ